MNYLLDTNAVIAFQKRNPRMAAALRRVAVDTVFVSSIVMFELYFGAMKGTKRNYSFGELGRLPFRSLEFTDTDALKAGQIRDDLRRRGEPIGPYDMLIAGQALARDLTVVTRNVREFGRVPELRVENWEG